METSSCLPCRQRSWICDVVALSVGEGREGRKRGEEERPRKKRKEMSRERGRGRVSGVEL